MGFNFVSFFPRAVMQGIPLLFGSTGEILTEKSGNLNLGIPGIMYVGGISGVIGSFFYEQSAGGQLNGFLAIMIPILCSLLGSLLMGLLYCFLTVTLRANQNVTGLAMTTFGVGVGNFFGGSLIKLTNSEVPSIALANTSRFFKTTLPGADSTGWFGQLFLSYGFLAYLAILIAIGASYFLNRTRPGLQIRHSRRPGNDYLSFWKLCHKLPSGTGASTSISCLDTGWTKRTRRACRQMLPSGLLRGAPYFRSPLIGQPILANWQRI